MRNASAHVAGGAAHWTKTLMPIWFFVFPFYRAKDCGSPFDPYTAAAFWSCYNLWKWYVDTWPRPALAQFQGTAGIGISAYNSKKFLKRIDELYKFQEDLIDATGKAINEQRLALEDYYDCDIRLVGWDRSGRAVANDKITPPLKKGRRWSFAVPVGARTIWDTSPNPLHETWPMSRTKEFYRMYLPGWIWPLQVRQIWTFSALAEYGILLFSDRAGKHHVLTTQWGIFEFGPLDLDEWKPFTIVAVARKRSDNTKSGQPPARPLDLMAPGLFRNSIVPMAYGQAETFHGIDGHVAKAAGAWAPLRYLGAYPFRMWTTWGWQWQPRLNRGDQLRNAIKDDTDLRNWLQPAGVSAPGDVDDLMLH
jgi:hypothetical protein